LMWAAAQGNAEAVTLLIKAGAAVDARSHGPTQTVVKAERSTSNYASDVDPDRVARGAAPDEPRLNSAISRDYRRPGRIDAYTPLLFAVRAGHLEAVRALLDGRANVNDAAPDGTSALAIAAINAHWELGVLLLDRGADPDAAAQGWTPLHQVARTRTLNIGQFPYPVPTGRLTGLDLARKLIAHGANVNARMTKEIVDGYRNRFNRIGATPLLLAAKGADVEMIRATPPTRRPEFASELYGPALHRIEVKRYTNESLSASSRPTCCFATMSTWCSTCRTPGEAGRGAGGVMKGEYAAGLSYRVATRRNCLILLTNRPTDVIGL